MPAVPSTVALTTIADGSNIVASDHRNNYSAVQTAINALVAVLAAATAKGDILVASGSAAYSRLPVGADNQLLVADAAQALGVKWGIKITTSTLAGGPPASPSDGDIWIATGVGGDTRRWKFQYDSGEATANKWKFIGGDGVYVTATTALPGTSTWTTLVSFTAVRAGVYQIAGGFYGTNGAGANAIQVGAGIAGVPSGTTGKISAIAASADYTLTGIPFEVTVTAGQAINLMGIASAASTPAFETMTVVPVRIA